MISFKTKLLLGSGLLWIFASAVSGLALHRLLRVTGKTGEITGAITITRGEQEWRFVPEKPWAAGPHELRIATAIEDHAGNSLARPFEVNLQRLVNRPLPAADVEVSLPFVVR